MKVGVVILRNLLAIRTAIFKGHSAWVFLVPRVKGQSTIVAGLRRKRWGLGGGVGGGVLVGGVVVVLVVVVDVGIHVDSRKVIVERRKA
jgi:hypothetical protein